MSDFVEKHMIVSATSLSDWTKGYDDGFLKCKNCKNEFKVEFRNSRTVNYCPCCGQKASIYKRKYIEQ